MPFPGSQDHALIARSEQLVHLADNLNEWLADFNPLRSEQKLAAIDENTESKLIEMHRTAMNLYNSSRTPVAAAVYGPSQTGKSLFVGQVLRPAEAAFCPLGRDESHGPPGYYAGLSFTYDLNPQAGANEATALVTRFTTKERMDRAPNEFPVVARALKRGEWLRVLARGFAAECHKDKKEIWTDDALEALVARCAADFGDAKTDRGWRIDLVNTWNYMQSVEDYRYQATQATFNGLLSRYGLSEEGCRRLAATLFWGEWSTLTALFDRVCQFIAEIESTGKPGLLAHWAAVRFLLDSQRKDVHKSKMSQHFPEVSWRDIQLRQQGGWRVLDYRPGGSGGTADLGVIQAAMLEMVIPVLPHRLTEPWRDIIQEIDLLDIPGVHAARGEVPGGRRTSADTFDEQMEIVKRGKVYYLFDRYIEDLQIQTLLLLISGRKLEVKGQINNYIDKWGQSRYRSGPQGKAWRLRVTEDPPAFFLGLTGIDEEFRNTKNDPVKELYEIRLKQVVDTLKPLMDEFGPRREIFTNVYLIRYPGTWDTTHQERVKEGAPQKWDHARAAFLSSELVHRYVRAPEERWDRAMDDQDGGLRLICQGFRQSTDPASKRRALEQSLEEVERQIVEMARDWVTPSDANLERKRRIHLAQRVLRWLHEDAGKAYYRIHVLSQSLDIEESDAGSLANFVHQAAAGAPLIVDPLPQRFAARLRDFLHEWTANMAPGRWRRFTEMHEAGAPWLSADDFHELTRCLRDYLLTEDVFAALLQRLLLVVEMELKDEAALRHARRKYVRLVLNDFVSNPGPDGGPPPGANGQNGAAEEPPAEAYGLMWPFLQRWSHRLVECCAAGAGRHVDIPPGNDELRDLLAETLGEEPPPDGEPGSEADSGPDAESPSDDECEEN
jgi:hypothetical protein